ncbi:hypothetical protein ACXX84_01795 [Mycoplasma sp. AC157]
MSLFKKIDFKKIEKIQWIYISLWILFSILLITVVLLLTLYTKPNLNNAELQAAALKVRADVIASFVLVFVIVFFGSILSTVIIHGFFIKKVKGVKQKNE